MKHDTGSINFSTHKTGYRLRMRAKLAPFPAPIRYAGFTLIELSIVLVIISLIVGGVLVGQDLIRASEIQSIVRQIEQVKVAVNTFRLKYNCLPGDCLSATAYGLGANGDGDKRIEDTFVDGTNEQWLFWTHLANAGLIDGTYSGVPGGVGGFPTADSIIGTNIPATDISGVGITLWYWPPPTIGSAKGGENHNKYYIVVGKDTSPDNFMTFGGFLSPLEAQSLDTKYDDGLANTGNIRVYGELTGHDTLGCTTGAEPNYSYTSDADAKCVLLFLTRF